VLTSDIKGCRELGELERILHEHRGVLNHIHVIAAWGCLAKIGADRGGDVRDAAAVLQDLTREVLGFVGGRGIAHAMHSMAKLSGLGVRVDVGLLEAMQRRATVTADEFTPLAVSSLLCTLTSMKARADRGLLEAMQRRATVAVAEFNIYVY
jgi:hypothetical protein